MSSRTFTSVFPGRECYEKESLPGVSGVSLQVLPASHQKEPSGVGAACIRGTQSCEGP